MEDQEEAEKERMSTLREKAWCWTMRGRSGLGLAARRAVVALLSDPHCIEVVCHGLEHDIMSEIGMHIPNQSPDSFIHICTWEYPFSGI